MERRDVVAAVGALTTSALAGCADEEGAESGADDEEPEPAGGQVGGTDAGTDEVHEGIQAINDAITVIDDELGVESGGVDSGYMWVEFHTSGELLEDLEVVGGAYAGAVEQGLEWKAEATAVRSETSVPEYDVTIRSEWAQQLVDEEISGQEYLERIEETLE